MAGIQSSTGLITGIPIEETVNKLMAIAARPRDLLDRTKQDAAIRAACRQPALVAGAGVQVRGDKLGKVSLFQSKTAASSDSKVLTAVTLPSGGNPAVGSYKFRVLQTASSQQC